MINANINSNIRRNANNNKLTSCGGGDATIFARIQVRLRLQVMDVALLHAEEGVARLALEVARLGTMKVARAGEFVDVLVGDEMSDEVVLRGKVQVAISAHKYLQSKQMLD